MGGFGSWGGSRESIWTQGGATDAAFDRESRSGGIDASVSRTAGALLIADLEDGVLVGSQAEHRRNSVRRVGAQILLDVLAGVEFRVLREIHGVADMTVQIDKARHDELTGQVDDLSSLWHGEPGGGADARNLAVVDNHGGIGYRWVALAVDEREVLEHLDLAESGEREQNAKGRKPFHGTDPP